MAEADWGPLTAFKSESIWCRKLFVIKAGSFEARQRNGTFRVSSYQRRFMDCFLLL